MRIEITRARPEQASRLSEIAWTARSHRGYPEHVLEQWRDELTLGPVFMRDRAVHAATVDDVPVGLHALGGSGDTLELDHFWIAPDWMGRGIGRTAAATLEDARRFLPRLRLELS